MDNLPQENFPTSPSEETLPPLENVLKILLELLRKGSLPGQVPASLAHNSTFLELTENLNELKRFAFSLSNGDLSQSLNQRGALAGSLKNLQATLLHLTWQTQQISQGDFSQRVDFMGDFSLAFNQMVENLAEARSALEKSEAVYRSMFEGNRAVQILVDDKQGLIIDANPAACVFYGYSREFLRGKSISELNLFPTDQMETFLKEIQTNGKNDPLVFPQQLANHEICTVEIYSSPIEISNQTLHYAIIHNITERKQAEEALQTRMRQVEALQAELKEQAIRDTLTGLYNRRYWHDLIEREFKRAERGRISLGLIMADVDHFKMVNDRFGHQMGDRVLQVLGKLLLSNIRGDDVACRYGGEEFVILLPGAAGDIVVARAESIRSQFEALCISEAGQQVKATLSLGVATFPEHGVRPNEVVAKADQALYAAKHRGRNMVVAYSDDLESK